MEEEMNSLHLNQTWDLVKLPSGKKVLKNRWVYVIKHEADGSRRYKARLVVKGYGQKHAIDFNEIFVLVVKHGSSLVINGYVDVNYAGCKKTRKSIMDYIFTFGGGPERNDCWAHDGQRDGEFDEMPEKDVVSWNTLSNRYASADQAELAIQVFDEMPERNLVSCWPCMQGHNEECLELFDGMMLVRDVKPDEAVSVNILMACTNLSDLGRGR
ncbi:pentatricopeptide repeat-containing protein At4g02750-like [Dioscorea cayenensis subsp. rotundata]|uniref:Pentatricopeptide repeat-containing protein At4g02750-like n=1 Tax=Dioscorea cayennensis subsp. rotundata TaxID=55577 RepID=A0AB40CT81_DIOCR|nr:pentatricopeptide repeat-containing protein At4g02750-like [Dioscorea cayenensis subsp. rotundata]